MTLVRAMDIADEFQDAEVVGVDLAPVQPRYASLCFHFVCFGESEMFALSVAVTSQRSPC